MAARAGAPRARALLRAASSPAWCEHVRLLCTTSRWSGTPSRAAQVARASARAGGGGGGEQGAGLETGARPGQHLLARGGRRAASAPRDLLASVVPNVLRSASFVRESGLSVDNGRRIPPGCGGPRSRSPVGVLAPS